MNSWKNYLDNNAKVIFGTFEDPTDGHKYRTITIGNQTWMADNYTKDVDGSFTVLDSAIGRLYSPNVIGSLAPEGWHIPTQSEWEELLSAIRKAQGDDVANALHPPFLKDYVDERDADFKSNELFVVRCVKDAPCNYIMDQNKKTFEDIKKQLEDAKNQTESYKKRFIDFKNRKEKELDNCRENAQKVTAELYEKYKSATQKLNEANRKIDEFKRLLAEYKKRLEELGEEPIDDTKSSKPKNKITASPEDLIDERDGEIYRTVNINGKIWLAQNLRFKKDLSNIECCSPDNNPDYDRSFGRLYTWNAAQKACPKGWHLPSSQEWKDLLAYMSETYGNSYKKQIIAPIFWNSDEGNVDFEMDKEGFSILPAGCANITEGHLKTSDALKLGFYMGFWTDNSQEALKSNDKQDDLDFVGTNAEWAYSVRCVKDNN